MINRWNNPRHRAVKRFCLWSIFRWLRAINKTITLNVAALEPAEDATANVAIFAVDKDGEKTGTALVTDTKAEIKDNVIEFDVSSKADFGDKDYVVTVKVGDNEETVNVSLEFKAVEKLVEDVKKATAAQLVGLLDNDAYFTGFDVAKVDAYKANVDAKKASIKTIADVQKLVIDAAAEASTFDAFVEEINEAKGVYAKYLVLKANFDFVDDANMDVYMDDSGPIFTDNAGKLEIDRTSVDSTEEVQDAIDEINLGEAVDGLTIANAKPSVLNDYKSALEALELVNDKVTANGETKAKWLVNIDAELDLIETARTAADAEIVKAEAAMAAYETAKGTGFADVKEYKDVVAAIEALEKEDLNKTELATATLEGAVTALKAETLDLTIVSVAQTAVSEFEKAYPGVIDENTLDTNADSVFNEYIAVMTVLYGDTFVDEGNYTGNTGDDLVLETGLTADDFDGTGQDTIIEELDAVTAKWVTYNAVMATEVPAEMRALLFKFADTGSSHYLNLTSAQKTEFAGRFIEHLADNDTTGMDSFGDVEGEFQTEVEAYSDLIKGVNEADTIGEMKAALSALQNDAYDNAGAQAQADIAEAMLGGTPYATIADIVAAMGL